MKLIVIGILGIVIIYAIVIIVGMVKALNGSGWIKKRR